MCLARDASRTQDTNRVWLFQARPKLSRDLGCQVIVCQLIQIYKRIHFKISISAGLN